MGLIGGDSSNSTETHAEQQQMTAGDTSPQVRSGNSSLNNIGGVTANNGGVVGATGALTIGQDNKGAITYVDSGGDVSKNAVDQMADVTKSLAQTFAAMSQNAATSTNQLAQSIQSSEQQQAQDAAARDQSVLAALTDLGKTTATGGQSDTNKTLLYVVYGVLAVAAVFILTPFLRKLVK